MGGLITLFILILFSAFFSGSETALTSVSKLRLHKILKEKKRGAKALNKLRSEPSSMLTTILIGNNVVNIWASVLAASLAMGYFKNLSNSSIFVGIVTGIMTFTVLVFGEIAPKTIAIRNVEKFALFVAPILLVFEFIFKPIAFVLRYITKPLVYLFGRSGERSVTEDEIKMVISAGEEAGVIEQEEREMISSIFEFGDTTVSEVMTPRPDIKAITLDKSLKELRFLIRQVGHSRIPVYEGNVDNIIGVVYTKDLIAKDGNRIKDYIRPVLVVPESKKIDDLMRQMQSARSHLAVAVDEYGITSGIVTLEDLIEEIVGEIHDEFEKEAKRIERLNDGSWLVDAKLSLDDFYEELKVQLPEGSYDTLAGFVVARLGKVPAVGDSIKFNGYLIKVEKVYRRRITRIKFEKINLTGQEAVGG